MSLKSISHTLSNVKKIMAFEKPMLTWCQSRRNIRNKYMRVDVVPKIQMQQDDAKWQDGQWVHTYKINMHIG